MKKQVNSQTNAAVVHSGSMAHDKASHLVEHLRSRIKSEESAFGPKHDFDTSSFYVDSLPSLNSMEFLNEFKDHIQLAGEAASLCFRSNESLLRGDLDNYMLGKESRTATASCDYHILPSQQSVDTVLRLSLGVSRPREWSKDLYRVPKGMTHYTAMFKLHSRDLPRESSSSTVHHDIRDEIWQKVIDDPNVPELRSIRDLEPGELQKTGQCIDVDEPKSLLPIWYMPGTEFGPGPLFYYGDSLDYFIDLIGRIAEAMGYTESALDGFGASYPRTEYLADRGKLNELWSGWQISALCQSKVAVTDLANGDFDAMSEYDWAPIAYFNRGRGDGDYRYYSLGIHRTGSGYVFEMGTDYRNASKLLETCREVTGFDDWHEPDATDLASML